MYCDVTVGVAGAAEQGGLPDEAGQQGEELAPALVRAEGRRAALLQVTCKCAL